MIAAVAILGALLFVSILVNLVLGLSLRELGGDRAQQLAASARKLAEQQPPAVWPPRRRDGAA